MMKPKHKKLLSIIIIFSMIFALCLPHDVKPIYAKYTYDYFTFKNVYFIITGDPDGASVNPITPTLRVSTLYSTDTINYPNVADLKTLTKDTYFNGASFTGEITLDSNNSVPSGAKKIIIPSNYYTIPENFLTGNTSIEEIVINSTNDIVLEKNCFSNMKALNKVTITANSVTLNGSVFSGCNNLETISITGKTTIANSQNFNNCSKLNTLNFNSDVNFISSSDFNSTSFSSCPNGATINFNGAVTNKASVFSYCKNITNINFNGYGNKLSNKFIFYSTVTNLNIENQTTLETNFLYDDKKHPITNLSFNATTIINDKAFYEGTIKNMYFNIDNRNNSKAISYVNSTDRLGYNTKVENIYFNYKDFNQIPDKVMELNNFPLGDTDTSSLNCDAIYFLNPNFKYIGGSDYDRCDGGTTDVYGYGGAVAYDTNGNIISSYEMYQSWIENKHCTFHNYVSNADTLNYSLKNNVVYLPANSNTIAYDFSSTNNITAYATYIDNTTPYDEINNQLKSSSEFPLTMATGETSSNFNYRILQKNNSVAGTNKDYYVYKYGNDYYTVCTNTVLNLTEGEHNFLIEAGGVKHPFKITVKKNVIEKITDVQPKSGSTLNLNYGETLEKDMLTVRAQYTNGENVILTNDQYDIENPLITAENLTITVSAKSDGTKKASNTIQVNGYPDEAKTFEVVCNKTEMPSGSTLTLADVQLKNVSYVNPSKPTDATIESGFKFIVDGKEVTEVPIKLGINTISISYKNYIVNNAIIIQGIENKISKVEAEYIGTGVYENCQIPTNAAVLAVYVYKNGSNTRELVTDYSKVTLENYKIIANQNNMITVYYDGIKAENPIVVPGLKDNVNTLDTVTYNGPCTIGTQLNQKDFYIEITLSSGTVLNSNSTPELLNALTFSEEKLNGETNQIKVTYDGKLEKTITINCNSVANTNAPTATLSPSPTTSSGPAITPTAGAIITTGPAVTQTPIVSSAPVPTVTPTPTIKATTKPTITPTIKPTITPTAEPTAEPTSTPTTTKPTVKKGKTYVVKNVRYKVCSFNKKRGTVAIVGYKKSAKSISVKSTVKIKGYTFTVVSIQSNAFKNCTALKGTIRIPSTITTVGNSAFYGCKNITCVVIGKKVKSIGSNCFYKCSKLKQVDLRSAKKLTKVGKAAFKKNASSRVFKIAKGTTSRFSKLLKGKY